MTGLPGMATHDNQNTVSYRPHSLQMKSRRLATAAF